MDINKIHNQDCLEAMKLMQDNQFDLAIVDPPYGIGVNKGGHTLAGNGNFKGGNFKVKAKKYDGGEWDSERPTQEYFYELQRVSKNQIIWGGNYFLIYYQHLLVGLFGIKTMEIATKQIVN